MSTRTITGNLAADPEVVKAGSVSITKLRVIENTGEYRGGKFVAHDTPTSHFVEARFELGENAAGSLHRGDAVIIVGKEHSNSWDKEGCKQYGRVIDADTIGVDLSRATAAVTRNAKQE